MKHARAAATTGFGSKLALFACVSIAWIVFDRVTKLWANSVSPGTVLVDSVAGLFQFILVHNTGAAWGIFSDSTFALGIFSIVVCVIILIVFFTYVRAEGNLFQTFALALVFAGGVGNAIDRLTYSYVVDFIKTTFIEFPVFNVADIGVTCGIVLFLIGMIVQDRRIDRTKKDSE